MKTDKWLAVLTRLQNHEARALTRSRFTKALIKATFCLAICGAVSAYALTGAIFTTDQTCTGVNENIFGNIKLSDNPTPQQIEAAKDLVHLDGGPHHPGSVGLPQGSYYVRVTDPSGAVVLGTSIGSGNDTPFVVGASGEPVDCYQLSAILIRGSNGTPGYDTTPNQGGEYKVWVSSVSTFDNNQSKTDNFKVRGQGGDQLPPEVATLNVRKFYDTNANGTFDGPDILLDDWRVVISGFVSPFLTPVSVTLEPGVYDVSEAKPNETDWFHTASLLDGVPQTFDPFPLSTPVSVSLATGQTREVLFGNLCVGAGGGLTLGFWSNKNGQALFGADDLALMVSLNLRNANGTHFNPTTYNSTPTSTAFRPWILSATATNMAYMLSAQLAAMELNVLNNKVNGGALIYAPGTNSANALGFATVNAVRGEANTLLGSADPLLILSGNPLRARAEALKNALDKANNNLTFVQVPVNGVSPCPFTFPNP